MGNVSRAARGAVQKVENNEGTDLEKYVKRGVFPSIKDYCYKGREKCSLYAKERVQEIINFILDYV